MGWHALRRSHPAPVRFRPAVSTADMPSRAAVSMERSISTTGPFPVARPVALEQSACEPVAGASGEGRGPDGLLQREGGGQRGDGLVAAIEQVQQHAPVAVRGPGAEHARTADDQLTGVGLELVDEQPGVFGGPETGDDLCALGERDGPEIVVGQPVQAPTRWSSASIAPATSPVSRRARPTVAAWIGPRFGRVVDGASMTASTSSKRPPSAATRAITMKYQGANPGTVSRIRAALVGTSTKRPSSWSRSAARAWATARMPRVPGVLAELQDLGAVGLEGGAPTEGQQQVAPAHVELSGDGDVHAGLRSGPTTDPRPRGRPRGPRRTGGAGRLRLGGPSAAKAICQRTAAPTLGAPGGMSASMAVAVSRSSTKSGMACDILSQARAATASGADGCRLRLEELQRFLAEPDRRHIEARDGDAEQPLSRPQLASGIDRRLARALGSSARA